MTVCKIALMPKWKGLKHCLETRQLKFEQAFVDNWFKRKCDFWLFNLRFAVKLRKIYLIEQNWEVYMPLFSQNTLFYNNYNLFSIEMGMILIFNIKITF